MRSRRKRHLPKRTASEVVAPIMEAQLVETAILTILNHQCLIATKASRVVYAAQGDGIMEFGLRRARDRMRDCTEQELRDRWMRRNFQCTRRRNV